MLVLLDQVLNLMLELAHLLDPEYEVGRLGTDLEFTDHHQGRLDHRLTGVLVLNLAELVTVVALLLVIELMPEVFEPLQEIKGMIEL